ncbi:MAG: hypothetical protein B7Z73_16880 [Planctomycetia bacterium 21-64-5]|nr:MAG: hypothetical protein B7Z73_16880 [Planctomycetia bacterium 21-64-5]
MSHSTADALDRGGPPARVRPPAMPQLPPRQLAARHNMARSDTPAPRRAQPSVAAKQGMPPQDVPGQPDNSDSPARPDKSGRRCSRRRHRSPAAVRNRHRPAPPAVDNPVCQAERQPATGSMAHWPRVATAVRDRLRPLIRAAALIRVTTGIATPVPGRRRAWPWE